MKVTVRWLDKVWDGKNMEFKTVGTGHEKVFTGDTAKEIMSAIWDFWDRHDLFKYTQAEIVNIED